MESEIWKCKNQEARKYLKPEIWKEKIQHVMNIETKKLKL